MPIKQEYKKAFEGFSDLRKHGDLIKKLGYDLDRMQLSPFNNYAAFDFFITAECLLDWSELEGGINKAARRKTEPLIALVSHIANGAKHFRATNSAHQSVNNIERLRYADMEYFCEDYIDEPVIVELRGDAQTLFGKDSVNILDIATRVYEYWNNQKALN